MKTSLKRFFAGVAAAAMAVGGLALGATSAQAAATASSHDGTLTIKADHGIDKHTLTAYKIAAYNSDYKTKDGSLDRDTFKYVVDSDDEHEIETALGEVHVTGQKSATESAAEEGLKQVAGQSADSPWGYKDTGDATERQFADTLANHIAGGWKPYSQIVNASAEGTSNNLPEGLYLIIDSYEPVQGTNKGTQSVPMLVGTTFASLTPTANESLGVGTITMKNTEVPVTKQVVETDNPTTPPYTTPSYSLGDKVTFELSTTIPDYAGYTKNADDPTAANARKLVLTDTFEQNANKKIPFSDPEVTSVKLYRNRTEVPNGVLTEDTDYTAIETKDADGSTVTGMKFDFGKLVNGNGITAKNTSWQTGDVIKVVLKATLNENAFVTAKAYSKILVSGKDPFGNANSVKVDFSDHTATGHHEVNGRTVNVYSFKFNLVKQYVKNPATKLPNAQFTIKNSADQYLTFADGKWGIAPADPTASDAYDTKDATVDSAKLAKTGIFVTNSNGEIAFNGLKADTYTVHEIKAPKDYFQNALPSFDVEIAAGWNTDVFNTAAGNGATSGDQSLASVEYTYHKGASGLVTATDGPVPATADTSTVTVDNVTSITELPKTGAAGIAFFSIIGVAIVAMAALFAVRARKAAKMA